MLGMGVSSDACDGVHYHLGLFARIALIVDTECIIGQWDTGTDIDSRGSVLGVQ